MKRTVAALVTLASLAAITASTAPAHPSTLVVHRGQAVTLSVLLSSKVGCLAAVRYADNAVQYTGVKHPLGGRITWTIRVPNNAAEGVARWSVRCGAAVRRTGTWKVAAATATETLPRVLVTNSGYSQRPDSYGGGSKVSYGIFLHNTSAKQDAQNVYVLVNFVGAGGELLGSMTQTVPLVSAGETYAFGNEMRLRTQQSVTSLEVTVRVPQGSPTIAHPLPHFANVIIVPDQREPQWISEVDGEIVNDTSPQTLTSAKLSVVMLDGSGNIVGGGTSTVYAPLPSGSRMVFLAQSGFTSVPTTKAASVIISVVPSYQTGS